MRAEALASPVGFANSELLGYSRTDDGLIVSLRAWNDKTLRLTFRDVIALHEICGWQVSKVVIAKEETATLVQALGRYYEIVPASHNFKEFQLLDLYDQPFLSVIASDCVVEVQES